MARRQGWERRNPEKDKAHDKAARIPLPETCELCGKRQDLLHRHHPDYSKPLLVEFLCPACHALTHKEMRAGFSR